MQDYLKLCTFKEIIQEQCFSNLCTGENGLRIRPCCLRYFESYLFTYVKMENKTETSRKHKASRFYKAQSVLSTSHTQLSKQRSLIVADTPLPSLIPRWTFPENFTAKNSTCISYYVHYIAMLSCLNL
jgi:hypothetical protein